MGKQQKRVIMMYTGITELKNGCKEAKYTAMINPESSCIK